MLQRLCICLVALLPLAAPRLAAADPALTIANALGYLRTQQQEDGSFGHPQPHLRTGLVMLAVLSHTTTPAAADRVLLERGTEYLLKTGTTGGDLGDDQFATESHAIATLALLCAHEHLRDGDRRAAAATRIQRALTYTQRLQDRSSSSTSRGGWKLEGRKGRINDRRSSAWAMLLYYAAARYGMEIPQANIDRGMRFMMGAFKAESEHPEQLGGFSVDTSGLTVALISAMGGWLMHISEADEKHRALNLAWFDRHPPHWGGPNYFYTNFFRTRLLKAADRDSARYRDLQARLAAQLSDHQQADGSVGLPPGNAQNTVAMGSVFATAMAVLILNADDSRLVCDEVYTPRPLF
jgi:hypothetical protein